MVSEKIKASQEEVFAPPEMQEPLAPEPAPIDFDGEGVGISDYGLKPACDSCGTNCSDCGSSMMACFCPRPWVHRSKIFGDFLYLQARGVNVAYAQPRDGLDPATSVPVGPAAVVATDYRPAYRVGGTFAWDDCSSITGSFTSFEGGTSNAVTTDIPFSFHSLVTYPATQSAASNSLEASADYDIRFRFADVGYRALLRGGPRWAVNYEIGARYAHLNQDLFVLQPISPGETWVESQLSFDGGGPRVGLDIERYSQRNGLYAYSKGYANFIAGRFHGEYLQRNTFALTQAQTSWRDDRLISILEYELGLGWTSPHGRLRVSAGYYVAGWFNTLTTPAWLNAVRTNNFDGASDTLAFDGLVTRAEWRW